MFIVRWFFGLLVLAALAFGAAYYFAGTLDGPAITINQPSVIGQGGTLDVTVDAPGAELSALDYSSWSRRAEPFPFSTSRRRRRARSSRKGDRVAHHAADRQEGAARTGSGPATVKVSASRPVFRRLRQVSSEASRDDAGAADASARRRRLDASLRQSGRRGNDRLPRHRRQTSSRACVSATSPIPGFPAPGAGLTRSRAQGGVLRAALQPERRHADGTVRARHRRQRGARAIRASRVSEDIPQQHDSARRQVSRRASCRRSCSARRS